MKSQATASCSVILALSLSLLLNLNVNAQCVSPAMVWENAVLVSGNPLETDAVYKFPSVTPGVDGYITILGSVNGATLTEIDNSTFGYSAAWQPVVRTPSEQVASESYIRFRIDFKDSADGKKHKYDCFQLSFIDVDGDNQHVQEFVAAKKPDNWLIANISWLAISFMENDMVKAMGPILNYPDLDTTAYVTNINYRYTNEDKVEEVWIGNKTDDNFVVQDRYTCGYFKEVAMPLQLLPVKMISFNANVVNNNQVNLQWITTNELNNSHFEVESSFDQQSYKTIGIVLDGNKISSTSKSYPFHDARSEIAGKPVIYYRLKQIDLDGKIAFSQVIRVKLQTTGSPELLVTPNPFAEKITMNFYSNTATHAEVQFINTTGQPLLTQKLTVSKGYNNTQVDGLDKLPPGVYLTRLFIDGKPVETRKIIKK